MLELALKLLLAYACGSVMGALLVGRAYGVDIRTMGSGNAGGTNALRTQGLSFAVCVVVVDVAKGWIAAAGLPPLALPGLAPDPVLSVDTMTYGCAFAAILGHVYPVWWEFRGGKGAATLIGALCAAMPLVLVPILVVWLIVVALTGFVGLGTMCAALALPVVVVMKPGATGPALAFAVAVAVFVVFTHRSNLRRMVTGAEPRARRIWLGTYLSRRDQ
jgi:glycerol-3-phosphate acyltransferase PlsY